MLRKLFSRHRKPRWVVILEMLGGPGASEPGVRFTVEGDDRQEAIRNAHEEAQRVVHSLVGTAVTGYRIESCEPCPGEGAR